MSFLSKKSFLSLFITTLLLSLSNIANAGCAITLKFVNKDNAPVNINFTKSKVKIKNGAWKKLVNGTGPTMNQGQSETISYNALFGCNFKRRYKFNFKKGGASWNQYYPSASAFTKRTTLIVNAKAP